MRSCRAPTSTVELHDLPEGRLPAVWGSVKEILEDVARSCSPDLIIAPSSDDAHQDHRTIGEIVPTVFRDQLYLAYEIPKWDGDIGRPSMYVPLSAQHRAAQGGAAAQVLPVAAGPRLVGRRGLPRPGPVARHGVPGALRRGVQMCKIRDSSHSCECVLRLLTLIHVSNLATAANDGTSRSRREMAPTGRARGWSV